MSKIITPEFTASYPNLFKARKNTLNDKEEFSVVALFAKGTDLSAIQNAIKAATVAKWGADTKKWPKGLRTPLRDQAERAKEDEVSGELLIPDGYEAGAFFLNLKCIQQPGLVDAKLQKIIDPSELYAGVVLRAEVNFYAYDKKGNRGVTCGLNHIQKVRDGRPLGGSRGTVESAFTALETESTGGDDDKLFT